MVGDVVANQAARLLAWKRLWALLLAPIETIESEATEARQPKPSPKQSASHSPVLRQTSGRHQVKGSSTGASIHPTRRQVQRPVQADSPARRRKAGKR